MLVGYIAFATATDIGHFWNVSQSEYCAEESAVGRRGKSQERRNRDMIAALPKVDHHTTAGWYSKRFRHARDSLLPTTLIMSGRTYPNLRVLRDVQRRQAVESTELLRKSYLFLARNTSIPQRVRVIATACRIAECLLVHLYDRPFVLYVQVRQQAQLALASRSIFPNVTRPVSVKERCTLTGRGRGILSKGLPFGLCRVGPTRRCTALRNG